MSGIKRIHPLCSVKILLLSWITIHNPSIPVISEINLLHIVVVILSVRTTTVCQSECILCLLEIVVYICMYVIMFCTISVIWNLCFCVFIFHVYHPHFNIIARWFVGVCMLLVNTISLELFDYHHDICMGARYGQKLWKVQKWLNSDALWYTVDDLPSVMF